MQLTEKQVSVEAALMGFINNDAAVLEQQEVLLQLPQQNAVCHELERSGLGQLAVVPHLQPQSPL